MILGVVNVLETIKINGYTTVLIFPTPVFSLKGSVFSVVGVV